MARCSLRALALAALATGGSRPQQPADLDALPAAPTEVRDDGRTLIISLPPQEVPVAPGGAEIMLHILAASKETPSPSVPWLLFRLPVERGDRYLLSGMLANDAPECLDDVSVRIVLDLVPPGRRWPLWDAYPWVMDVKFPVGGAGGSKAFDLPPGRSSPERGPDGAVARLPLGRFYEPLRR